MASTILYPNLSSSESAINETEATTLKRTLIALDYCIGTFGLIGNMFVLIVLGSSSTLRKVRINKLIMNQSTIDFLGALFLILSVAIDDANQRNAAFCALWVTKLPFWIVMISSTFSLVLITIERYLGVVHVTWYKEKMTDRHMIISMSIIWIFVISYASALAISTCKIAANGSCIMYSVYPSLSVKRAVGVFVFTVNFLIPILIHVFCYFRICHILWIRKKTGIDGIDIFNESDEDVPISNRKVMRNVVLTLITVTVCFVTCWFCHQFYFLLAHLEYSVDFHSDFYQFTVIVVACNCCINPVVFMVQYKQFKERAKKMFSSFRKYNTQNTAEKYERKLDSSSTPVV